MENASHSIRLDTLCNYKVCLLAFSFLLPAKCFKSEILGFFCVLLSMVYKQEKL